MSLSNRLVRSATWEGIANSDGSITEESYEIYDELASGGVGAIRPLLIRCRLLPWRIKHRMSR